MNKMIDIALKQVKNNKVLIVSNNDNIDMNNIVVTINGKEANIHEIKANNYEELLFVAIKGYNYLKTTYTCPGVINIGQGDELHIKIQKDNKTINEQIYTM